MMACAERRTRERILEAAEAFFADRGYHGTRLHEIARSVGVQKASLFHHFPSKAELYRATLLHGLSDTERVIRAAIESHEPPAERVRRLIAAYVDLLAAHPQRMKVLVRQTLDEVPFTRSAEGRRLLDLVAQFVAAGQRTGAFRPADAVALVLGVVGAVAFLFASAPAFAPLWPANPLDGATVERVKRHFTDLVVRSLTEARDTETPAAGASPSRRAIAAHAVPG
jgi:TetR/AcrR family transcriptional regulator